MNQLNLEIFSSRLRDLREEHELSIRALAKALGTSSATISRYETRKRQPSLSLVYSISKYFNVSMDYLCDEFIHSDKDKLLKIFCKLSNESKKEGIQYISFLCEKEVNK